MLKTAATISVPAFFSLTLSFFPPQRFFFSVLGAFDFFPPFALTLRFFFPLGYRNAVSFSFMLFLFSLHLPLRQQSSFFFSFSGRGTLRFQFFFSILFSVLWCSSCRFSSVLKTTFVWHVSLYEFPVSFHAIPSHPQSGTVWESWCVFKHLITNLPRLSLLFVCQSLPVQSVFLRLVSPLAPFIDWNYLYSTNQMWLKILQSHLTTHSSLVCSIYDRTEAIWIVEQRL